MNERSVPGGEDLAGASTRRQLPGSHWLGFGLVLACMFCALALILADQALLAMAGLVAIPLGLVCLRSPDLATAFILFAIYTNTPANLIQVHKLPFIVGAAIPLLLAVPIAANVFVRQRPVLVTPVLILLLAFFGVQVLGALLAEKADIAVLELFDAFAEGILIYVLVSNAVRTTRALHLSVWALLLAGAFLGAISLFQQMTGTFDNDYGGYAQVSEAAFEVDEGGSEQPRLGGPFGKQNRFAQIMAMLLPLVFFVYWSVPRQRIRFLALLCFPLIGVGMALAFSRGAAVAIGLTFGIMTLLGYLRVRHIALVAVAGLIVALLVPQYAVRLASLGNVARLVSEMQGPGLRNADSATRSRLTEMWAAGLAFAEHPLIGVGPGMYPYYYRHYAERVGLKIKANRREAHTLLLGVAAENGLLGLSLLIAMLGVTFRDLWMCRRRWARERPDLSHLSTGLAMMLVMYLTTGLFLHFAYIRYFWLVMALAGSARYLADVESRAGEPRAPERRTLVFRPVLVGRVGGVPR